MRQPPSATTSSPAETTAPCAPTGANPSATATAGPSPPCTGTGGSPCPTLADTAPPPFPPSTPSHLRLGYAANAHGHQGDTVDVSLAVITEATSHRSLYVAATRGRDENRLFVVTDEADQARDVLEHVLANDRTDLPAVAQRRNLARQVPRTRDAEQEVAAARHALDEARRQAEPELRPLHAAEEQLRVAEQRLQKQRRTLDEAPWWRRRAMTALVRDASDAVERAQATVDHQERAAAPHTARIASAQERLREAEHHASVARLSDRLDRLHLEPPSRTIERGVGIEPPGLSL